MRVIICPSLCPMALAASTTGRETVATPETVAARTGGIARMSNTMVDGTMGNRIPKLISRVSQVSNPRDGMARSAPVAAITPDAPFPVCPR